MFTYRKIALCHTAYVTDHAMECQEFRQSIVSKSNFNRKINKLLVRIFQQGWYFYDRKRPNFQKMQKTQYRNFHCIYTLKKIASWNSYPKHVVFLLIKRFKQHQSTSNENNNETETNDNRPILWLEMPYIYILVQKVNNYYVASKKNFYAVLTLTYKLKRE